MVKELFRNMECIVFTIYYFCIFFEKNLHYETLNMRKWRFIPSLLRDIGKHSIAYEKHYLLTMLFLNRALYMLFRIPNLWYGPINSGLSAHPSVGPFVTLISQN